MWGDEPCNELWEDEPWNELWDDESWNELWDETSDEMCVKPWDKILEEKSVAGKFIPIWASFDEAKHKIIFFVIWIQKIVDLFYMHYK